MAYDLKYMGTATIRQARTKVEVTARRFEEPGGALPIPDPTYRWGGSYWGPTVGEGTLTEGGATFRFHDATEGEAVITRLPSERRKGKFRGTGELRSLY